MTREEKIEAFTMVLDGYTYQQIGDRFGVTKQWIQEMLSRGMPMRIRHSKKLSDACIYPVLAKAILEKDYNATDLYYLLHEMLTEKNPRSYYYVWCLSRVSGKQSFTAKEWFRLSEALGIPLSDLMKESD